MATRHIVPVLGDQLVVGTKPYIASGKYIKRNRSLLESNGRTVLQVRNYDRRPSAERDSILLRASSVFDTVSGGQL